MSPRVLLLIAAALFSTVTASQTYPQRPVRIVVGFPPGGGVDINARLLAPKLSEYFGQQFVVDNKPGAGTNIANEIVARAPADGYTLLFTSPALAINMSLYSKLTFDTLRDFAPISMLSESPNVLVVPAGLPVANVQDLVARARANPGKLNFSSAGVGTSQHLAAVLFTLRTGTTALHIPYKGSSPSLTALIANEVDFSFANIPAIHGHIKGGKLRGLAITAPKRDSQLPDVPTMKEAGVDGVEVSVWFGAFAPIATPKEIVRTLAIAMQRAARDGDMRKRLNEQGAEPVGSTPEEFAKFMREEIARWAEVVKASGAKAE